MHCVFTIISALSFVSDICSFILTRGLCIVFQSKGKTIHSSKMVLFFLIFISPTFISVLNIYNELLEKGYDILFCWIPGHTGTKGNEQADKATKRTSNHLKMVVPYCVT